MATHQGKLKIAQRKYLQQLGLSNDAVDVYQKTLRAGRLTAAAAAGNSGKYASAEYRLFYKLESLGLVRREGGRPMIFTAIEPDVAFPVAARVRAADVEGALHVAIVHAAQHDEGAGLRILVGKQALYDEYARMTPFAKESIDLYTIGIAFSPELVAVQRAAVRRGVRIQHVVQEVKLRNLHVVTTWQKLGVDLRKSTADRGFHLMIFDGVRAIASFSNPHNTEDRFSIITDNPAALRMFTRYFDQIWQQATELQL